MKTRKIPMRQCIGCGESKSKKELLRIIKTPENEIRLDPTGKQNGRGAYVCISDDCFQKAVKSKSLERTLKMEIPNEVYNEMERQMKETNAK